MRKSLLNTSAGAVTAALIALTTPAHAQDQAAADALFAEEKWAEAAEAYQAAATSDQGNAAAWYGLAQSQHRLEEFSAAISAYEKALDAGYQPAALARYHLARALMSAERDDEALTQLEEIAKTGGPNFRTVQNTAEFEPLLEQPRFVAVIEALTPCTDEPYRHFAFWIGEWDVTAAGAPQPGAENSITSVHDGCAMLEQYSAGGGAFTGMSINFYDASDETWNQTWIANTGAPLYLKGGLDDNGAMVMSDAHIAKDGQAINRITWSENDDGSVRQLWETSSDEGESWSIAFDGRYDRKTSE